MAHLPPPAEIKREAIATCVSAGKWSGMLYDDAFHEKYGVRIRVSCQHGKPVFVEVITLGR